jgi:aerobic-type carbon monoxide dehydrogenase small subunit (CoxS/CutS family)
MDNINNVFVLKSDLYVFAASAEIDEGNIIFNGNNITNVWEGNSSSLEMFTLDITNDIEKNNLLFFEATGGTVLSLHKIIVVESKLDISSSVDLKTEYTKTIQAGVNNTLTLTVVNNGTDDGKDIQVKVLRENTEIASFIIDDFVVGKDNVFTVVDTQIRPIDENTVYGAENPLANYTVIAGNSTFEFSFPVRYNGNLGKDYEYPKVNNTEITREYEITGDVIIINSPDSSYMASSSTNRTETFTVEDNSNIVEGLLYIPYNWDNIAAGDYLSWIVTINDNAITPIANYRDQGNLGGYGNRGYGLVVYNITEFIISGDNEVTLNRDAGGCAVYPQSVLILTNNTSSNCVKRIYIAENADLLAKINSKSLTVGAKTIFEGIDLTNLTKSSLYVFAASAQAGEGNIIFNNINEADVWNGSAYSIDLFTLDITDIISENNNLFFESTGATILALHQIIVVESVSEKQDLEINASCEAIAAGEDAIIVVSGLKDATGNVSANINGEGYSAEIMGGVATIVVPGLTENATATINYPGDDRYNAANTAVDIVVNPVPEPKKDLTLNASAMTFGQNVTIIVTGFENATGNVTVTIGEDNYTSTIMMGMAFVSIPQMDENVTAYIYYPGDDNYNNASTSVDIVAKKNLNLTASADAIYVGENATIIITGFENATGNVTVIAGRGFYNATIADGIATVTVQGLNNTTTAYIIYIGDNNYNLAYTSVNITVLPAPAPKENLTLEVTAEPITAGEDAVIVVGGLANATGNVSASVNGEEYSAEIVDGSALIVVSGLAENVTALISYLGDDNYNAANATVDIVVNPVPVPSKENLTLEVTAEPITAGEDAVIVVGGLANATGNVSAAVNGEEYSAEIISGVATIVVSGLAENVTALISYPGDDNYNAANATVDITVNPKPKENATMDIDVPPVTEGQNVTINVELPEDATGNVTAAVDGKNYTAQVKDGKATIAIPELVAGDYTVPVTYSGDDKYNSLTKEVKVTVEEDKSDIISAPDVTKYYNGPERFVVTVTDYQGNPLANKTVTIYINGVKYTRTTNATGEASMALGLNSGKYNATVTVDNQTVNSVVTILATVNGTDIVKVFRNATQYFATFLDSEGKFLADGTTVKFNINGVMYERKVSGDKGLARLNINLPAGEYTITAINPETGENAANNITVLSLLTENKDLTKYYRNESQYTVKVLGADGKAVGAGVTVRFNINGVFYERQTNEFGIARLNINLPPGDYIITAEYSGCRVSNNIKVLPVLKAADITIKYRDGTQFKTNLVDGQGKPFAGQNVEFNINGVFYNRATDSNGQAKLNINLMPGEYIITSSYNGSSIANTIKINSM